MFLLLLFCQKELNDPLAPLISKGTKAATADCDDYICSGFMQRYNQYYYLHNYKYLP